MFSFAALTFGPAIRQTWDRQMQLVWDGFAYELAYISD